MERKEKMITKMTASKKEGDSPTLKRPLTALLVAPNEITWNNIVAGKKKITIREGHRDYQPGLVMLCCHLINKAVQADITDARHCRLDEVTREEYTGDGYKTPSEMRDDLRQCYPSIDYFSPVTVIKWDNVKGKLVDEYYSDCPAGLRQITEKVVTKK